MPIINGTDLGDTLNDTSDNDTIYGGGGNDTITMSGGNDILYGGDGDDTFVIRGGNGFTNYGGSGFDTLDLHFLVAGISLSYFGSDNAEYTIGTNFADTFSASSSVTQALRLDGMAGTDQITGGGGNDVLVGGADADTLNGGAGDDTYAWNPGDGNDIIANTGGGFDTVYFGSVASSAVRFEIGASNVNVVVSNSSVITLQNQNTAANIVERLTFGGGGNAIDLRAGFSYSGTQLGETLYGGFYNDTINALGGNDTVYGRNGDDRLEGGDGTDALYGEEGADVLNGGALDDQLYGGEGDDVLVGGTGNDRMDGGTGAGDWAWYRGETASLNVNLANSAASGASIGTDTLYNIENVHGSEAADQISGSTAANIINGGGGNDTIVASAGADQLLGGAGDDTIDGGVDNDVIYGDEPFAPNQTATASGTAPSGSPLAISLTGALSDPDATTSVFGYVGARAPDAGSLNIVYVIDVSGSMDSTFQGNEAVGDLNRDGDANTLMDGAIASYTALNNSLVAAGLGNTARVSLVAFDDSSSVIYSGRAGTDANNNGVADVVESLRTLVPGGGTYYDRGLQSTISAISSSPSGSNYVFFISDGEPNGGEYTDEVATLLSSYNARIRALGLGNGASLPALDLVDDNAANSSAERVLTPSQITAGLLAPQVDVNAIDHVDIYVNGMLGARIGAGDLVTTPFGLQFNAELAGLSTTAADTITATVVTTGGNPVKISTQINVAQVTNIAGGADVLRGGDGQDTIDGNAGNDQLYGEAGDDVLVGGLGNDRVDGGTGYDTIDFTGQFDDLTLDLGAGTASGQVSGSDVLVSIERAIGGYGNDRLIASTTGYAIAVDVVKDAAVNNDSITNALSLNGTFLLTPNGNITSAETIPHSTVRAEGGGHSDFYGFNAVAGSTIILDIDGASFDTVLELYNAAGTRLTSNDDSTSDPGSTSNNSYLTYQIGAAGTYYARVRSYSNDTIATGQSYTLHVSAPGQQSANPALIGSELVGGAGNDVLLSRQYADRLEGGAGNDTFEGTRAQLNGDTIMDLSPGDRIHVTDAPAGFGITQFGNQLTFSTGERITLVGDGQVLVRTASDGGVDLFIRPDVEHDFNGDGRSDILWRNVNGRLTDWLSTGTSFNGATGVDYYVGTDWKVAGNGDFTGDGKSDILFRNDNGRITTWNATSAGFNGATGVDYGVSADWKVAGVGDFNGDGRDDILWRNDNGRITDWFSTGAGFNGATGVDYYAGADWKVAGVGDINGDGRDDIVWRNDSGRTTVWLATASGFNGATGLDYNVSADWKVAGIGDFNGDGREDILWRNDNGTLTDWFSTGNGFNPNSAFNLAVSNAWVVEGTGDYNGDGRADILWRNTDGSVAEWVSTGNGFAPVGAADAVVGTDWMIVV